MVALTWDPSVRPYYDGVDRGVLYLPSTNGVAWQGLVSIVEKSSDNIDSDYFIDGVRFAITQSLEPFDFTMTAYSYPEEFELCVGQDGIYDNQPSSRFGMSYRTGDAETGQIHLVYNAKAKASDKTYGTISNQTDPLLFVWDVSTVPKHYDLVAPTSHIVIELGEIYDSVKEVLFPILYGSAVTNPRLPDFSELYDLFRDNAALVVIDNGDGTWSATGNDDIVQMLDPTTFQITWSSAVYISEDTYNISSY